MSLTINNGQLSQQQILQPQSTATQTSADTTQTSTDAPATASTAAAANPAATYVSGKAALTSDLLAVLLQGQTAATASYGFPDPVQTGDGPVSLAGILDAQDAATQSSQDDVSSFDADPTADLFTTLTQEQTGASPDSGLDATTAAQSATSTNSVLSGIQDLLDQLGS